MSNFKEVKSCKCEDCLHNKICMYKKSLEGITEKLITNIEEDKFSDEAPFIINIECQFKDTGVTAKTVNPVERNINQVLYQPNKVVTDVDKVASDPKSVINNMTPSFKEPMPTPSHIKTIQNGVVTDNGVTVKKKLTTEEKVAMMKEYATSQYIPNADKIYDREDANNIPIQTPAEGTETN